MLSCCVVVLVGSLKSTEKESGRELMVTLLFEFERERGGREFGAREFDEEFVRLGDMREFGASDAIKGDSNDE